MDSSTEREVDADDGDDRQGEVDQRQPYAEVVEPSSLCCPVMQTVFRDPVFVPESGNTYEREALQTFWRASQITGAPPRDPLNNTALSSTQVFVNWDKRREVAAWLQDNPGVVPKGWSCRSDIPPADGLARGANPPQFPGRRHVHVEFNLHLQLTARHLGIFAVVATSLFCGLGCHQLLCTYSFSKPDSHGTGSAAAAVATAQQYRYTFTLPSSSPFSKLQGEIDEILTTRKRVKANDFASFGGNVLLTEAKERERLIEHLLDMGYLGTGNRVVYPTARRSQMLRAGPEGSRVKVAIAPAAAGKSATESLIIFVPPLPTRDVDFPEISTAIFVIVFVFFWTKQASSQGAPFLFVLFSAPFWYTGGMLVRRSIMRHVETSSLQVSRQRLVVSQDLLGVFAKTSEIELHQINNFQVKTKLIVNGQPQGVLEIREQEALHEWGSPLSVTELDFIHKQVVEYLARGAAEMSGSAPDLASQGQQHAHAIYLAGGNFWAFAQDSPLHAQSEGLNRMLLAKFKTNQIVTPADFESFVIEDQDGRHPSKLFEELQVKGYVVADDAGDFRVTMPPSV